jgi:hypothetical protein
MNIIDSFRLDGPVAVVTGEARGSARGLRWLWRRPGQTWLWWLDAHCRAERQPAASRRHAMRAVS